MSPKSSHWFVSNLPKLSDVIGEICDQSLEQHPPWNEYRNCLVRVSESGCPVSSLTYRDARYALVHHREWLQRALDYSFAVETQQESALKQTVVAYIAGNSADFFLSVLACSDLTLEVNNKQKGTTLLAALLNTRWSATEMACLLQTTSNGSDRTIILYGPTFRSKAMDLVSRLSRKQEKNPLVCCKPIPEYTTHSTANNISFQSDSSYHSESRVLDPAKEIHRLSSFSSHRKIDALILFTSGTTSGPKGVRLSHTALLIQALAKIGPPCYISSETRMLASTSPFYHVGGLTNLLAVWLAGGALLFRDNRRQSVSGFDPAFLLRSMNMANHPYDCNTLVLVPAMIHMIQQITNPSSTGLFPNVQLVLIGGQSAPPSALDFLRCHFPKARIVQTYACTEAASSLTFLEVTVANNPTAVSSTKSEILPGDCIGKPRPHVEIALLGTDGRDRDSKKITTPTFARFVVKDPFRVGLIATRGPHVMNGYWNRADPNPLEIDHKDQLDWFVSNDLGFWDLHGNLYFCGRASDTIRTGGETVLALEVERVLQQHKNVGEVAVFPIPDDRLGEQVACAIVRKNLNQGDCSLKQVQSWCKEHGLAGYKCPRSVFWVSSLPRNSSGKVLKSELKLLFGEGNKNGRIESRL